MTALFHLERSSIQIPDKSPEEVKLGWKHLYAAMFSAALSLPTETWKQVQHPLADEGINKWWCTDTVDHPPPFRVGNLVLQEMSICMKVAGTLGWDKMESSI